MATQFRNWLNTNQLDKLYVNGTWQAAHSDRFDTIVNPATEAVIGTVVSGSALDADHAIGAARGAFDDGRWAEADRQYRADKMRALHDAVVARRDDIQSLMIAEMGYTLGECTGMMNLGIRLIEHYVEMARRDPVRPLPIVTGPTPHGTTTLGAAVLIHEPIGVVSAITPYNAGMFLGLVKAVPALAAGNTVVLKPSPFTPLQSFMLAELMEALDLPPGVFNMVTGEADVGALLSADPRIDMVSFTGSDGVGTKVMEQAAPTLKKVHLELGGKSALIVCRDADLDRAVGSGMAAYAQCGQGCALVTRHLVHNEVREAYVDKLVTAASALKVGDPADPTVRVGPLIRETARARTERFVETALSDGAELRAGGRRPAELEQGFFYEPTIFNNVDPNSNLAQEEVFGPIVAVIGYDSDDQAIAIANNSKYGLSGGIHSADAGAAYAMSRRIRTGMVQINGGPGAPHPHMPFGGFKLSGLGREWGDTGYYEFTELKSVGFRAG